MRNSESVLSYPFVCLVRTRMASQTRMEFLYMYSLSDLLCLSALFTRILLIPAFLFELHIVSHD
jgi:hypothetical protein